MLAGVEELRRPASDLRADREPVATTPTATEKPTETAGPSEGPSRGRLRHSGSRPWWRVRGGSALVCQRADQLMVT